jgi:hypothetical protein
MTEPNNPQPGSAVSPELPRWTLDGMRTFIATLRRTRSVAAAARAAGMSRQAAYRLRARLPGHPFDRAWEAALAPREAFRLMTTGYAAAMAATAADGPAAPVRDATGGNGG